MDTGEEIIAKLFEAFDAEDGSCEPSPVPTGAPDSRRMKQDLESHSQWAIGSNGKFMPVGSTLPRLAAGIYEPFAAPGMYGLELLHVASDGIYTLPDMATEAVMKEVSTFWQNEQKYRDHHLLYKRGLLLWGPPGGGKTITIKLLMNALVKNDGIVVLGSNIGLTVLCLKSIRRIEPTRNLIVVLEDIDEIINSNGEAQVLSMLDGEHNIDQVLNLASTNYPERLGARIINRPSRFDRRIYVGMPGPDARKVYLEKTTKDGLDAQTLQQWVIDTDGMSIAHLRELVAAVYCLDQSYDGVLERLRAMCVRLKGEEGFKTKKPGFGVSYPTAESKTMSLTELMRESKDFVGPEV